MVYLLLLGAILVEVMAAIATRFSDGFTKLIPTGLTVVGVVGAYYLLSRVVQQGMGIGVAYGIWAALGVTAVAVVGAVFLGDSLTLVQVLGIVLVVAGVVSLEMGGEH